MTVPARRILLVEDNPPDARLVRAMLEEGRLRYDIVLADRLEDAIARLAEEAIDLMLLDLSLPDSSGLDTVKRAHAAARDVPIIVLTGIGDQEVAIGAVSEGAQDYLVKGDLETQLLERSIAYAIERKAVEQLLQRAAFHDASTGLPNRALLLERLERVMLRQKRHGAKFAILSIQLDNHRAIADSFGHSVADRWLASMAERLAGRMQPEDTLARVGPDQLIALVEDFRDLGAAVRLADGMQDCLLLPEMVNGHELFTTASIGVTTSDAPHSRAEEHLRDAGVAMHRARGLGGRRHEVFAAPMHEGIVARLQLEGDLRRGLERGELEMYYQPIVWLQTGDVAGFEALLRWRHPQRGLLAPGEFLDAAEEASLMPAVFAATFGRAAELLRTWQTASRGGPTPFLNVNLSPSQLVAAEVLDHIDAVLAQVAIAPYSLGVEITESVLVDDDEAALRTVHALRARKLRVLLDDFGVGYSSLSYLYRFPIDALKVDRSFLAQVGVNGRGTEIVRAIMNLAQGMGMGTTAEGIETPEQLSFVKGLGCDLGQGYYFARPLDADAASACLTRGYSIGDGLPPSVRFTSARRSQGRVLLVDDDRAGSNLLRLQLEECDFEVVAADSGMQCLEKAAIVQPDVILLDIEMPGMDGIETCRRLKNSADVTAIPVLFVTGRREDDPTIVDALGAGGNDFLSKDAPRAILVARLRSQVAIGRAQAQLRRAAMTDELTGVFSRRFMFDSLRRAVKTLSRHGPQGLSLLLADIDHFKRVNDTRGHLEGDRLLAKVARTIDETTRDTDLVARYGGEEFVIILPDTSLEGAERVAETVRSAVMRSCAATVSIGGAHLSEAPFDMVRDRTILDGLIEQMLHAADVAMYDAKRLGRNRVVIRVEPVKLDTE